MTRRHRLRELPEGELRRVRGAGILLPALGQTRDNNIALEEVSITCEELTRRR